MIGIDWTALILAGITLLLVSRQVGIWMGQAHRRGFDQGWDAAVAAQQAGTEPEQEGMA